MDDFIAMTQHEQFVPTLILIALLLLALVVLLRAQRRDDFDISEMLRDDAGKISSTRIFAFVALAVSSWIMASLTVTQKLNENYFLYYLITWSGATVLMKFIERWSGGMAAPSQPAAYVAPSGPSVGPGAGEVRDP